MKKTTIHAPNYKDCGIGYTTTPTCVVENPHQWGLTGNSFRLWAYLVSRIKKEQYFNGSTIKTQLTGTMGESAVTAALKNLCENGFCTKKPHRDKRGQLAGCAYTFYAIPKDRDRVQKISPDVCEKLSAKGWFDLPEDGIPSSGALPDDGNPPHGEALFKGKDEIQEKEKNQGTTPNPLLGKEGSSADLSGKVDSQPDSPASSGSTVDSATTAAPAGQHFRKLSQSPVGSRLLKMLRPAQIPGDKALRPLSREVEKGKITNAYLTFLWEKLIQPNQESADKTGSLLKSVPEILEFVKGESYSPNSTLFRQWRPNRISDLKRQWLKGHENLSIEEFQQRVEERTADGPFNGIAFAHGELKPDSYCNPFRLYVYWKLSQGGDIICNENTLLEALYDGPIWNHLLDQAATNLEQFLSLELLVHNLKDKLPPNRPTEVQELREDYCVRHSSKMEQLKAAFADMGCQPPQITSAG